MKFGQNPINGLGGDGRLKKLFTEDGRTHDGRRTNCDHKSSTCHYVTAELKSAHRRRRHH